MKANTMKRVLAFALSATMIFASAMTVFAEPVNGEDSSTAGTGQILDFKVQKQVVPTSLSIAINPNGHPVNLRYTKVASDAEYSSSTKYYTKNDQGVYSVATDIIAEGSGANWTTKRAAGLYTATTSSAQIISFNYAFANKSTVARKVAVTLNVAADENVKFVATQAEATNEAVADDGGAKKGEYKVFLQLKPVAAGKTIKTDTYAKATAYGATTQYYTRGSDGKYSEATIADEEAFKGSSSQLYVATDTIGTEIQAKELADVTVASTDWSSAPITFKAGAGSTSADVTYSLPKATYTLKSSEYIDMNTTSTNFDQKFEMTGIGGLAGFTIDGAMNTNTEWNTLTTKTISITPTYEITDATGLETAVSTGLNQVETVAKTVTVTIKNKGDFTGEDTTKTMTVGADPSNPDTVEGYTFTKYYSDATCETEFTGKVAADTTTLYAKWTKDRYTSATAISVTSNEVTVTLPSGVTVSSIKLVSGTTETNLTQGTHYSVAGNKYTFDATKVPNWTGKSVKFTFSDGTNESLSVQ